MSQFIHFQPPAFAVMSDKVLNRLSPTVMSKINIDHLELLPAYGRDYKSAKAVKADFFANKDFRLADITYARPLCSISDFSHGVTVLLRYRQERMVTSVRVNHQNKNQHKTT